MKIDEYPLKGVSFYKFFGYIISRFLQLCNQFGSYSGRDPVPNTDDLVPFLKQKYVQ